MRRPSPAMAVAVVALLAACAGSATAATLITGKQIRDESLTSADVRDRSLRGKDLRSNTISGRNVHKLSGRDVIRDGLDGSDVLESTFDIVPSAAKARTADRATTAGSADAVAGARIVRVQADQAPGTAAQTVYDAGGLRIQASCSAEGRLAVRATPSVDGGGYLRLVITRPGSPPETTLVTDNAFDGADAANLVQGGADNAVGTLTYAAPAGDVTTLQYLVHSAGVCRLSGNALHTTP